MGKFLIEKIKDNEFLIKVPKRLYCKEAVFSAAHKLTDRFYIVIDHIDENYVGVYIQVKPEFNSTEEDIKISFLQFSNDLIDQQLRIDLEKNYGKIREFIVEQAFSPLGLSDLSSKIKKNLIEIKENGEEMFNKIPYYFLPFRFLRFPESTMLLVNITDRTNTGVYSPSKVFCST